MGQVSINGSTRIVVVHEFKINNPTGKRRPLPYIAFKKETNKEQVSIV